MTMENLRATGPLLLVGLSVTLAIFFLIPYGEALLGGALPPVHFRAWVWPSAYGFVIGLLGLFAFVLVRIGLGRRALVRAGGYGLAIGLLAYSFYSVER